MTCKLFLIGMGAGAPNLLTVQAIDVLNRANVLFIPDKGVEKAYLRRVRLYEVIPRINSVQLLAARHRIALTRIGEPVFLTPPRRLASGLPDDVVSVVVLLDGEKTFARLDGDSFDIYWGAYLGLPEEILIAGSLSEVSGQIEAIRGRARREMGWIMDIYLLRRRSPVQ